MNSRQNSINAVLIYSKMSPKLLKIQGFEYELIVSMVLTKRFLKDLIRFFSCLHFLVSLQSHDSISLIKKQAVGSFK